MAIPGADIVSGEVPTDAKLLPPEEPLLPEQGAEDLPAIGPAGMPLVEGDQSAEMIAQPQKSPSLVSERTGTAASDDIDSYYARSEERGRRRPPREFLSDDIISNLASPISLCEPKQLHRRMERQKRARSRSWTQQVGPRPNATRFRDRTVSAVYDEDEDVDDLNYPHTLDRTYPTADGFAQRARGWRQWRDSTHAVSR